jgi:hypothetical protein
MTAFLIIAWTWIVKHWRLVGYIALALIVAIAVIVLFRSCGHKPPKLDEQAIQAGEEAVKQKNDEELRKILTNSDVSTIDANVAEGRNATVNAIAESKERYANMNTSELAAELEKRK